MEAAAADVTHISELYAFVTVNRCWFPEVLIISANEWHHNGRESVPQSISKGKEAHLPSNLS